VAFTIAARIIVAHLAAPPDRIWNLRGTGAGDFTVVVDVSGRNELAPFFVSRDPKDLRQICVASGETEAIARRATDARLAAPRNAAADPEDAFWTRQAAGQLYAYFGQLAEGAEQLEAAYALSQTEPAAGRSAPPAQTLEEIIGVAHLRRGELDNCVAHHNADRCIFPVSGGGVHADQSGSKRAIAFLTRALAHDPANLEVRWLLNVTYMTIGQYPSGVPADVVIAPERFASEAPQARFQDVALSSGVEIRTRAGGTVIEDINGDGALDIAMSSSDPCEPLHLFRNRGDGYFDDVSAEAKVLDQTGGLNLTQTDYNNDGRLDLYVHRGGWEAEPSRNSLLRQNADGTFTDVTGEAGLLNGPSNRTHSVAWADYDNDGWLDAFEAHENTPSALFHNERNGTFVNVAAQAGVARVAISKGAAWGDYDNDGLPDLYVSNFASRNFLYHNKRHGVFEEVAERLRVDRPIMSFPTWFFDYDNDGWLDLFVSNYVPSVTEIVRAFLGMPQTAETMKLYRNTGRGGFKDVTVESGLAHVTQAMGANYGDIDNDGFSDIYLATGAPSYASIVPNALFRNDGGKRFLDVTTASGTGHLQKGHGVGMGDLDGDGDEEIVVNIGGFVPGDAYWKAIFSNPGTPNHWLTVSLVGARSNRFGVGARIDAWIKDANGSLSRRHRVVSSGGSFGSSSFAQHIGLGQAQRVERLEIWWPASGVKQMFRDLAVDQRIVVREGSDTIETGTNPR
jgi:hypothetical protein